MRESSDGKWDEVWIGANIATMTSGSGAYGSIADAALAVKGERIAWIGAAAEGRRRAETQRASIRDAQGLWITPGDRRYTHLVYGGNWGGIEQRLCG